MLNVLFVKNNLIFPCWVRIENFSGGVTVDHSPPQYCLQTTLLPAFLPHGTKLNNVELLQWRQGTSSSYGLSLCPCVFLWCALLALLNVSAACRHGKQQESQASSSMLAWIFKHFTPFIWVRVISMDVIIHREAEHSLKRLAARLSD